MTIWHYQGGSQVGRVVDHDYKALGVDALRVIIDGSTFNFSPGTSHYLKKNMRERERERCIW